MARYAREGIDIPWGGAAVDGRDPADVAAALRGFGRDDTAPAPAPAARRQTGIGRFLTGAQPDEPEEVQRPARRRGRAMGLHPLEERGRHAQVCGATFHGKPGRVVSHCLRISGTSLASR